MCRYFVSAVAIGLSLTLTACATTRQVSVTETAPVNSSYVEVTPVLTQGLSAEQQADILQAGQAAFAAKDYALAYTEYQKLSFEPGGETYALRLGDCAFALGHFETARAHFEMAARSPQRYAGLVLARIALGQVQDPELELNAALEINLADFRLWNALGRFYDGRERWIEAQEIYVRAIVSGADRAAVINNMGISLMAQGRYGEAQDKFYQAMELSPDVALYDNNRRLTLALLGEYNRVDDVLSSEAAAVLYNDAGYIAMQRGKRNLARTLFERALEASPVHLVKAEENLKLLALAP